MPLAAAVRTAAGFGMYGFIAHMIELGRPEVEISPASTAEGVVVFQLAIARQEKNRATCDDFFAAIRGC